MFTPLSLWEDSVPGGLCQIKGCSGQAWKEGPGARSPQRGDRRADSCPPARVFSFLGLKATWDPAFPPPTRCKQGGHVGGGRGPGGSSAT